MKLPQSSPAEVATSGSEFYVVSGKTIARMLTGLRDAVFETVRTAYQLHNRGQSVNPDSYFLRFPEKPEARIIALPAYLAGSVEKAGLKWISSFPANRARDLPRASAVLILNDYDTGYPMACLEASLISAHRTAASAALAAEALHAGRRDGALAVIGNGPIAWTTVEWLLSRSWRFDSIHLFDTVRARSERFARRLTPLVACTPSIAEDSATAIRAASLVVIATTAASPHIHDVDLFAGCPTILHLSLRDLSIENVLAAQNIVDDVEHCLKAGTSLHLAEQRLGHRHFVAGTLSDVLEGKIRPDPARPRVFSPFGLGILDLAVGDLIFRHALMSGTAIQVPNFFAPLEA
jgi:N-[(2S)-2-amino-2-carboxyethyl]-L-glutamate dehydrogenase